MKRNKRKPLIDQLAQQATDHPAEWAREVEFFFRAWDGLSSDNSVSAIIQLAQTELKGLDASAELFVHLSQIVLHELVIRCMADQVAKEFSESQEKPVSPDALDPQVSPPDLELEAQWKTPPVQSNNPRDKE